MMRASVVTEPRLLRERITARRAGKQRYRQRLCIKPKVMTTMKPPWICPPLAPAIIMVS